MQVKRKQAAKILDHIRVLLAKGTEPQQIELILSRQYDIEPLKKCQGEAHSNAHVDNCGVCAPRWGFVGDAVEIR